MSIGSDVSVLPAGMLLRTRPLKRTCLSVQEMIVLELLPVLATVQLEIVSGSRPYSFENVRRTCEPEAVCCTVTRDDTAATVTPRSSSTPSSDRLALMGLVLHALTQLSPVPAAEAAGSIEQTSSRASVRDSTFFNAFFMVSSS